MSGRIAVSKKLLIINSASSFATRLLSVTALLWVQQYLLKHVSVDEYSLLPLIYSLMILAPFFTQILTGGIRRYVTEAYADHDEERISQIVTSMFPLLCLGGLFLFIIGSVLAWKINVVLLIAPDYVDDARLMLMLIIFTEALRLPVQAFNSGLYVKQRFLLESLIRVATESVRLTLLFTLLLGFKVSVVSVVISTVAASFLEMVVMLIISRRLLTSQRLEWSKFDWLIVKKLIRFGGWSSLYGFTGMIRKAAGPIILNRLATPLDVTCFHLGSLVPNRLEVIVNQSFLGSLSPVVVGLHADKQEERLKNIYLRLGRIAMWGMLFVISPFLVHYEQVVRLYVGETYLSAGTVMFLLLASYPIVYGNVLHTSLANAKVRMRSLATRETISAVIHLSLTMVLVGYYQLGAIGVATATFIVYGLGSTLLFWPFGKGMVEATWTEIGNEILLPGIVPFCAAILAMQLLVMSYPVNSWSGIAINSMFGGAIYIVVLWLVAKDLDKSQFRVALRNLVRKARS